MLQFSDTTNKNGIIQGIERTLFGDDGDGRITGNSTLFAMITSDVNLALSRAMHLIFEADGTWQYDDANHSTYNILTANIVSGQRSYTFTEDTAGNLLLSLHKLAIKNDATTSDYTELSPRDAQTEPYNIFVETTLSGTPTSYDKTATGIFFDNTPNYSATDGIKVYVDRTGSVFTTGDTTKKPGFAGLYHEYLILHPSWKYASRNGLANKNDLREQVLEMEEALMSHYMKRKGDENDALSVEPISYQ